MNLFPLKEKLELYTLQLQLLESVPYDGGLVDLEDCSYTMNNYGEEIGLLKCYEDEMYYVNTEVYQKLYDGLCKDLGLATEANNVQ